MTSVIAQSRLSLRGDWPAGLRFIIGMLTGCVRQATWDGVGGPGTIAPFEAPGIRAIVVSQTEAVHDKIEKLLSELRAARDNRANRTNQIGSSLPMPSRVRRTHGLRRLGARL